MNILITIIFQYMIEGFLLGYVSLKLFKVTSSLKQLLLIGTLHGLAIYLVRKLYELLNIQLGTHSLILLIVLIFLLRYIGKAPWLYAISGGISTVTLIYLASPLAYKLIEIANWDIEQVLASPLLLLVAGYTELTYVILAAITLTVTRFNIPDFLKFRE